MIDEALRSEHPLEIVPTMDTNGHGTFVASVACGSADAENVFMGMAPEADIAVVKLKEAKQYLRDFYFIHSDAPCYQENDMKSLLPFYPARSSATCPQLFYFPDFLPTGRI